MQHYVPNLALEVARHNEVSANADTKINLEGFLVGENSFIFTSGNDPLHLFLNLEDVTSAEPITSWEEI